MSEWFADRVSGECGVVGETGWSVIVDGSTFSFFCWQTFPNGRRAFCASDRDESQTFRHEELEQQTRPIIHSHVHSPLAPHPPNLSIHVWRCILRSHTMVFTVCCQSIQTPIASKVNVRLRSQKENKKQNAWKQCRFTVLLHYRWCWNRKVLEEVICDWIIVVELCVFKAPLVRKHRAPAYAWGLSRDRGIVERVVKWRPSPVAIETRDGRQSSGYWGGFWLS